MDPLAQACSPLPTLLKLSRRVERADRLAEEQAEGQGGEGGVGYASEGKGLAVPGGCFGGETGKPGEGLEEAARGGEGLEVVGDGGRGPAVLGGETVPGGGWGGGDRGAVAGCGWGGGAGEASMPGSTVLEEGGGRFWIDGPPLAALLDRSST